MAGTRKECTTPCQHKDPIGGGKFCKFNKEFENGKAPCPFVQPNNIRNERAKLKEFWKP